MKASEPAQKQHKAREFTVNDKKLEFKFIIYVLKLKGGNYYVGRTTPQGLQARINLHKAGKGSAWTRMHPFVKEMESLYIKNASPFDEDRRVKQLMYLYGPNKVRGGTYSKTQQLTPKQAQFIQKQMRGAADECLHCGDKDHFIQACQKYKMDMERKKYRNQQHQAEQFSGSQEQDSDQDQGSFDSIDSDGSDSYSGSRGRYFNRTPRKNYNSYVSYQRINEDQCRYCKKYGHWEQQCWKRKRDLQNTYYRR